ncbi:MAG TPA: S41 family peptidase [bacterium]|nr:S41 family peptidase [bacterium]
MQHPNRTASKSWLALLMAVVLVAALGGGIIPARAATGSLVISAIDALERNYVDPIHQTDLLNAAIATLRQQTHAGPGVLPDIPAGASAMEAQQQFLAEFDGAVQTGAEPENQLAYDATAGMLASLHDSHVYYMDPTRFQENRRSLNGAPGFSGIGVIITGAADAASVRWVFVENVFPGSPAEGAGLKRFDKIVAVGGTSLRGATVQQASSLIRGPAGTPVVLTIERAGQPAEVTITRGAIQSRPVIAQFVEPGVAYVRLFEFSKGAARAVRSGLLGLAEQGQIRSVILDLRGNPGGLISEADGVASLFLPGGTPIARVIDRQSASVLRTMGQPPFAQVPLVVLTNGGSASGSEIVTGAFKDLHRAQIVGDKTAGALGGAIDVALPEGGMSVTVERITTPSGRVVEAVGISPDVAVTLGESDMEQGVDTQLQAALRAAGTIGLHR